MKNITLLQKDINNFTNWLYVFFRCWPSIMRLVDYHTLYLKCLFFKMYDTSVNSTPTLVHFLVTEITSYSMWVYCSSGLRIFELVQSQIREYQLAPGTCFMKVTYSYSPENFKKLVTNFTYSQVKFYRFTIANIKVSDVSSLH